MLLLECVPEVPRPNILLCIEVGEGDDLGSAMSHFHTNPSSGQTVQCRQQALVAAALRHAEVELRQDEVEECNELLHNMPIDVSFPGRAAAVDTLASMRYLWTEVQSAADHCHP